MLVTTVVAVMVAITQRVDDKAIDDREFVRILIVLSCISLYHFLIFWPLWFAGFLANMKWLMLLISIIVFVLTIYAQASFFDAILDVGVSYPEMLMLDLTFALTIAIHLAIANFNGYQLVQRNRANAIS